MIIVGIVKIETVVVLVEDLKNFVVNGVIKSIKERVVIPNDIR